jgi:pilus assembly protein FimV
MSILLTSQAQAFQLGQPSLQSQLGQPLKLEVQVSDLTPQEIQDFQVVLADDTVYQTAKINRVAGLENITLSLIKRSEDVYVLQMQGTEPLLSPYVDVLLELLICFLCFCFGVGVILLSPGDCASSGSVLIVG